MKKRGFTLIELLAVIVILAIIALIAVPIVLHIIEDSKKSSQKESINMYGKAVEDAAASYLLKNPNDNDITFDKIKDYINYSSGEKIECTDTKIYTNGKIYLGECSIGGTEVEYTYGEKEKTLCTLAEDTGETGLSIGDKYTCEVKDNTNYTFYVLSEESDKVNLIMDRNICEDGSIKYTIANHYCRYSYHEEEDNSNYGPDTAMTNLYQATKDWTNVPNMIMNYTDENNTNNEAIGYKGIVTNSKTKITTIFGKNNVAETQIGTYEFPLKARLPMEYEIRGTACDGNYGSCPAWIVENLRYFDTNEYLRYDKYNLNYKNLDNTELGAITAYWLLSSYNDDLSKARILSCQGIVSSMKTHSRSGAGIRPVITVSIDNLSS